MLEPGSNLGLVEQEPRPPGNTNTVPPEKPPAEQHITKIPAEQFFTHPCSFKKSSKRQHVSWCELPLPSTYPTLLYSPLSVRFLFFLKTFRIRRIAFCVGKKAFWIDWKWLPFGSLQANRQQDISHQPSSSLQNQEIPPSLIWISNMPLGGDERSGSACYTSCTSQIQHQLEDAVYSETPTLLLPTHQLWAFLAAKVAALSPITEDWIKLQHPLPCTLGANKSNKQNKSEPAKKFLPVTLYHTCTDSVVNTDSDAFTSNKWNKSGRGTGRMTRTYWEDSSSTDISSIFKWCRFPSLYQHQLQLPRGHEKAAGQCVSMFLKLLHGSFKIKLIYLCWSIYL